MSQTRAPDAAAQRPGATPGPHRRHALRQLRLLVLAAGLAQPLAIGHRGDAVAVLVHRHVAALAEHNLVGRLCRRGAGE